MLKNILYVVFFIHCISYIFIINCHDRTLNNPVDPRYTLTAPELLSASTNNENHIILSWKNIDGAPESFNIYKKTNEENEKIIDTISGKKDTFTDLSINEENTYKYLVQADWYGRESKLSNSLQVNFSNYYMKLFQKHDETRGVDVIATADEGFLILCRTRKKLYTNYLWLIKSDRYGNQEWSKLFEIENDEIFSNIELCNDGYILMKNSRLVKIDLSGNELWVKNLKHSYCRSIKKGVDGYFILSTGSIFRNIEPVLIKTDFEGNQVWVQEIFKDPLIMASNLDVLPDGDIITCGIIKLDEYPTRSYCELLKISKETGNIITKSTINGTDINKNSRDDAFCYALDVSNDGSINMLFTLGSQSFDVPVGQTWLVKSNTYLNVLWSKRIMGFSTSGISIKNMHDQSMIVLMTNDENTHGRDSYSLIKFDSFGELEWEKDFNGIRNAYARSVSVTSNNDIIVVGSTTEDGNRTQESGFALKLDSFGIYDDENIIY